MEIAHFVVVDVSHCEAGDPLVTLCNRHLERAMNGRPHNTEQQMPLLKKTHGHSSNKLLIVRQKFWAEFINHSEKLVHCLIFVLLCTCMFQCIYFFRASLFRFVHTSVSLSTAFRSNSVISFLTPSCTVKPLLITKGISSSTGVMVMVNLWVTCNDKSSLFQVLLRRRVLSLFLTISYHVTEITQLPRLFHPRLCMWRRPCFPRWDWCGSTWHC